MKMTERDVEMLRFINENGFCITPHLERRFGIRNWRVSQLMKRLIDDGYVCRARVFQGLPNIYYVTSKGASFSGLPALDRISVAIYEHQVTLTDVVIKLCEQYPEAVWISERQLRFEKCINGIGRRGHVADGMFHFPDNKRVAIEVELSLKGRHRIEQILKAYAAELEINEIWYFCSIYTMKTLMELAGKKSYIKIYSIKEFLS